MTGNWIVLGDATTSGGSMISCTPFTDVDGKGVCRKGDEATCPQHKGTFPITGGCDPTTIIDGQEVALHGATLACGCKVVSTRQMRVFLDEGGDASAIGSTAADQTAISSAHCAEGSLPHDEAFILISELTGRPLANRQYKVVRVDGAIEEGATDEDGLTHVVTSDMPEVLHVEIAEERIAA